MEHKLAKRSSSCLASSNQFISASTILSSFVKLSGGFTELILAAKSKIQA